MINNTKVTLKAFSQTLKLVLVFLIVSNAEAQNNSTSPYSRFGIGEVQSLDFAETDAMGGANVAIHDPFTINFANPASYSSLKLTSLEFGAQTNFTSYSASGYASNITNASNISYVALAFPVIANTWGASFGLVPYSSVGYNISSNGTTMNGDASSYLYTGNGGINQFYFGNAINIFKGVSIGANISDLFGNIQKVNTVEFPYMSSNYDTRTTNTIYVRDFSYHLGVIIMDDSLRVDSAKYFVSKYKLKIISNTTAGLVIANSKDTVFIVNKVAEGHKLTVISNTYEGIEYSNSKDTLFINNSNGKLREDSLKNAIQKVRIKSDHSLSFGFTTSLNTKVKATSDSLVERYDYSGGTLLVFDTVNYTNQVKGYIRLPLTLGLGLSYREGLRLLISADLTVANWSQFTSFGVNDQYSNSMKAAAGVQISPDLMKAKTFLGSITYRFGAYYNKTFLDLNNTQINDIGFTFGLGLPVFRSISKINLTFQVGQLGTLANNLIREDYAKIGIGFSLADKWFNKHKFE